MADVQFIIDEVRRSKPTTVIMGVLLVGGAIAASFIPVETPAPAWVPVVKWGGLVALVVLGILLFLLALQPSEKHPAVVLLTTAPESIVWGHVVVVKRNGQHTATILKLYTDAGKELEAPLPRSAEGERRGLALVREVAPRAATGYSPEREAQFKKAPASLRTG